MRAAPRIPSPPKPSAGCASGCAAPAGLLLHVRRSETDQQGHGQVVAVAHGRHALTDPVAAVNAWRETPALRTCLRR